MSHRRHRHLLWLTLGLLALGLLLMAWPSRAEKPLSLYTSESWTRADGLPDDSVVAIAESDNGFLWLATSDGLARFDGNLIHVDAPLRGWQLRESVAALMATADGALWVGTTHRGLWRLQVKEAPRQWSREHGLPSDAVLSLGIAPGGQLIAGTRHGAVHVVGDRAVALGGVPPLPVRAIAVSDSRLWMSSDDGRLWAVDDDLQVEPVALPAPATGALAADADGVWVATPIGIHRHGGVDAGRMLGVPDGLASTLIRALLVDRHQHLWVGFAGDGVQRFAERRWQRFDREHGIHHPYVNALLEDRHGAVWIGTGLGATRLRDAPVTTFQRAHGLGSDYVRSISLDASGRAWVGSDGGGLARIDGFQVRRFTREDGLHGDTVRAVATGSDGSVWVASYGVGLQRLLDGDWKGWTPADGLPSVLIEALLVEPDGTVWLGSSDRGVARLHDGRFDVFDRSSGLPSNEVHALLRRADGSLLIGTADAGIAVLRDGRISALLDRGTGLPFQRIETLFEDAHQRLWIGAEEGLLRLDGERTLDLRGLDPVLAHAVRFIGDDRHDGLWFAGSRGVLHLPAIGLVLLDRGERTRAATHLRMLGRSDGMPLAAINGGTQPSAAVGADGRLWLPTPRGLAVVDPHRLAPEHPLPRMQIESVRVDGEALSLEHAHLRLEPGVSRLEVGFGGVHSLGVDRPQFQWRMDGLHTEWSRPGVDRIIEFAALPPGFYRFRVRAVGERGGRTSEEASISFTVTPRFYQHGWFVAAVGLSLVMLASGAVWLRHRRLLEDRRRLAAEVDRRTIALREALARAEHLAQAKSSFLANMSHELRTPLSAIIGYTEHAARADPATATSAVRRIERHARLLLDLVNDVLDASRIDAGKLAVSLEPVSPQAVSEDVVQLLAERANAKGLALRLQLAGVLPDTVQADALRLKQVLLNLVGNAIKFSERGTIRLRVSGSPRHDLCRFEIEDDGIGMNPAEVARLFRPFEQIDTAATRRHGGSGLGLYISRQLVERMGGRITVSSTPGRGSCFGVELPVAADTPWQAPSTAARVTEDSNVAAPSLRGSVLIAEDSDDIRDLLRVVIADTGAEVVAVADGLAAVDAALQRRFDLVLMDVHMPRLDGNEATRRLRLHGYTGAIIALTADVLAESMAVHREAGADLVMTKPVDRRRLFGLLRLFLASAEAPPVDTALGPMQAQLTERFVQRLPAEADAMLAAWQAGDRATLVDRLHRLKGSCGMFGLTREAELATIAEAALAGDSDSGGTTREIVYRLAAALRARAGNATDRSLDDDQRVPDTDAQP